MKVEKPDLVQLASGASRFAIPAHDIKYDSRSPVSTAGHSTLEMLGQLGDAIATHVTTHQAIEWHLPLLRAVVARARLVTSVAEALLEAHVEEEARRAETRGEPGPRADAHGARGRRRGRGRERAGRRAADASRSLVEGAEGAAEDERVSAGRGGREPRSRAHRDGAVLASGGSAYGRLGLGERARAAARSRRLARVPALCAKVRVAAIAARAELARSS